MTYSYRNYEFTAFTEADLLQGTNGSSIGYGDRFTMPGSATVNLSTWDNDGSLSGDYYDRATDGSGQNAWVDGHRVGGQLYAEQYHVLRGSDGNYYYLIEIEIEGHDAPGAGDDYFTFYGRVPPAGVELTVVNTCNVSGSWIDYRCLTAGDTAPANTPPSFTNLPQDGILRIDENSVFVIDADAQDADGDSLTYEIVGGRDAAFFEIDAHTGELSFVNPPDYENPQSGGGDNTYDVTIRVSDGNGGEEIKPLWVKVQDVDEGGNGDCIVIEAEDMYACGFVTVHGNQASGGELARLPHAGGSGYLTTVFEGPSGSYDLSLYAQDENDGNSVIKVAVNGVLVKTFVLNGNGDGGGSDNGGFSQFTLDDLNLNTGDRVTLWAWSDCGEYVRIDRLELCQDGETCPPDFIKLDFEGEGRGTVVDTQFDGVTITAQRDGYNTPANDAMIFDADHPTGGDWDLGFAGQGNILIISEDNDSNDPDDAAAGGTITFDFDNASDLHDIKIFDIEENGGTIVLTHSDGSTTTINIPATGNNTSQTIMLGAQDVVKMEVNLAGSGAVDDLCWRPGDEPLPGAIEGRVFCDTDNDNQDNNNGDEPGVAGVIVELLDDGGNVIATTTTAADGTYSFTGLGAGDYAVRFPSTVDGKTLVDANVGDDVSDSDAVDNGDGTATTGTVVVVAGETTSDVDAGIEDPGTASIAGRYFCDENNNDQDDNNGDEPGIGGITVELLDAGGNVLATTTTATDGSYSFTGLGAGDYAVRFPSSAGGKTLVDPNVGDDASDSDAVDNGDGTATTGTISLSLGENVTDVDAGVEDPDTASLAGRYFCDENDNDRDDAEPAIAGATVWLWKDGVATGLSTTTDANGNYEFTGLSAGDYHVVFAAEPSGKAFVAPNVGDDIDDSDVIVVNSDGTGMSETVSLAIGERVENLDAGVEDPGTASLGDRVWIDRNRNGIQDGGEMGLAGVGVVLLDALGNAIATTSTDGNGNYLFSGLDAGIYAIAFDEPDGFDFTLQDVGNDADDSDANPGTGETAQVTLALGETNLTVDAGVVSEDPDAMDDAAMTCADETVTVDVLANDVDDEPLTITMVDGQAITEGGTVDVAGVLVTLTGGQLVFDGTTAYAGLLIGDEVTQTISYSVEDGNGGMATADVDLTFCGALNTLQTIEDSLPAGGDFTVTVDIVGDEFYNVTLNGTGDARFDGVTFFDAYCVAAYEPIDTGVAVPFNMYLADEASAPVGLVANPDDLDIVNWILNQDFKSMDNGDGTGETYTDAEIQGAIWGFTDDIVFVDDAAGLGTTSNAQEIYDLALLNGDGFVAGEGDIVGLLLDPTAAAEAEGNIQPFIIGIAWDDIAQDCLCV